MKAVLAKHWRLRGARGTRLASLLIAVVIMVVLFGVWLAAPTVLTRGELLLYDQQFRLRGPRPGHDAVVIVAIDDKSLREVGRWPWPRHVLAEIVRRLDEAGVATIAFDIILSEPEQGGELRAARAIRERLGGRLDARALRDIDAVIRAADHDAALAEAISQSGRVVLASVFELAATPPPAPPERQGQPFKSAILSFRQYDDRGLFAPLNADGVSLPIPPLQEAARALGHVNMQADLDGVTRWEALVVEHRGHYYPSLAVEAVRVAAGIEPFAVKLAFGDVLEIADLAVPLDPRARVLVDYAGPGGTFAHYSAADVLAGRVPAERLRDRIVFLGATAEGTYDLRVTPLSPVLPGVEKHANVAANLIDRRFIIRPAWVEVAEAAALVALPILLGWLLPRFRPLSSLALALGIEIVLAGAVHLAFRRGLWLPVMYPSVALGLTFVGVTVYRFLTEERQRQWTKRAFQQYVAPEVVERIVADPSALQFGGEVRELTVLFADIRGFTTFSERHEPHEVASRLREHLTAMTEVVLAERGTLDKYIGDAVMAIFGAPVALPDHAVRACCAALRMVEETERLAAKGEAEGRDPFYIGVGVNTGQMVVGNLGSEQLFSYTVVGDEVNLGARLEAATREHRPARWIIISESTYNAARDMIEARPLGEVKVKGKTRPVVIYELLAMKPDAAPAAP